MTLRRSARQPRLVALALLIALLSAFLGASPASAASGSITGKVTKPDGKALKSAVVDLYSVDADGYIFEKSVKTNSDGNYTLGSLERGTYTVGFGSDSSTYAAEFWNNKTHIQVATTISVGTSKVSSINAKLAVGGKVIGRVLTDSSPSPSRPVAGAEVAAYRYDDGEWTYGKSVVTASDGSYTLGGFAEGYWTLEFNPPTEGPNADLALEYWEDSRTFDDNDIFLVKPGMTLEDKEAHLGPAGRISGRVTGPSGEPVVDALVFGYPATFQEQVGNVAFTDENGNYVMTGLSPGQHRLEFVDGLEFDPFGDGPDYTSEWWDDEGSFATANRVTVSAGSTSTGKNAQLDDDRAPLQNVVPPRIIGEAQAGEALTVDPGTWTPRVDEEGFTYRWYWDDRLVQGVTGKTYTPMGDQVGSRISVHVTATARNGQTTTIITPSTDPVRKGVLRNTAKPWIEGNLRVGSQITLMNGEWNVPVLASVELLADGEKVGSSRYETLTADLLGKKLSVRVTASKHGWDPVTLTGDETAPVTEGIFSHPATVEIQGVPIVGTPVEARLLNSNSSTTYAYQWLANGEDIAGADELEFAPTTAEIGKSLTVRLTMSNPGWKTAETISNVSDPVVAEGSLHVTPGTPTITGSARVGESLEGGLGAWEPWGELRMSYQWLADGEPIPGAIDARHTLTAAQANKRISFQVTGERPGWTPATAVSAETGPVATSTPFGAPRDLTVTSNSVTSVGLSWTKVDGAAKYRIYYGIGSGTRTKVEVGNVTTATLKGLKPGTGYSIDIAALRSDGTRSSYSPRINGQTESLDPPSDLAVSQTTSTSVTLTWTKAPGGVPKYRIYHGIGSGTRTKTEVGDVNTATIKGLKPNTTYSIDIASLLDDGTTRSAYTPRIPATTKP
jgi:hypothetical protein